MEALEHVGIGDIDFGVTITFVFVSKHSIFFQLRVDKERCRTIPIVKARKTKTF